MCASVIIYEAISNFKNIEYKIKWNGVLLNKYLSCQLLDDQNFNCRPPLPPTVAVVAAAAITNIISSKTTDDTKLHSASHSRGVMGRVRRLRCAGFR